jgi:hypothetical protein
LWIAEKNLTTSVSQTSVGVSVERWHIGGDEGYQTEGFSVLRGTTAGVYDTRYDVLPKPGVILFKGRHDVSTWVDLGTSMSVATDFTTGFPTTYPTVGGPYLAVDESGWEPDIAYGVTVTPSWLTTVAVTAKRRDGFDLSFGTAAPANATIDWLLVR